MHPCTTAAVMRGRRTPCSSIPPIFAMYSRTVLSTMAMIVLALLQAPRGACFITLPLMMRARSGAPTAGAAGSHGEMTGRGAKWGTVGVCRRAEAVMLSSVSKLKMRRSSGMWATEPTAAASAETTEEPDEIDLDIETQVSSRCCGLRPTAN